MSHDGSTERSGRRLRWPLSSVNTIIVAAFLVGGLTALLLGHLEVGVPLLTGAVFGGIGSAIARRSSAGDLERVNAMEYLDERERTAGVKGLAVVGVVGLFAALLQMLAILVFGDDYEPMPWAFGSLLALCVAWFLANWFFVRRG